MEVRYYKYIQNNEGLALILISLIKDVRVVVIVRNNEIQSHKGTFITTNTNLNKKFP